MTKQSKYNAENIDIFGDNLGKKTPKQMSASELRNELRELSMEPFLCKKKEKRLEDIEEELRIRKLF